MSKRFTPKRRSFHLTHVWFNAKHNTLYVSYIGDKDTDSTLGKYVQHEVDQRLRRGDVYLGTLGKR